MSTRFIVGDVIEVLRTLPDDSVDLVFTSPPFLALRSYLPADHPDKAKEIGSEPTPGEFIDALLDVTEELARVLAPHGSLCFELGDTYSGSGGGGGDYLPGGLRDGQPGFAGSANASREEHTAAAAAAHWRQKNASKRRALRRDAMPDILPPQQRRGRTAMDNLDGWPLDKSLCLIPELYRTSLSYGFNPLTGRQTERWRVRNVVRWHRPNPPVGALGDKFRPATSEVVVACKSRTRYFDLDAVRAEPSDWVQKYGDGTGYAQQPRKTVAERADKGQRNHEGNPAGAPPLDTWIIPTSPYKGSHYATFPPKLVVKPLLSMCPERVCMTCGEPSRRIAETTNAIGESTGRRAWRAGTDGIGAGHVGTITRSSSSAPSAERLTTGWTECGHGSYACSSCGVLVPLDYALRRPGKSARGKEKVGAEVLLGQSVEGTSGQTHDAGGMRTVRDRLPGSAGSEMLHSELLCEVGAPGGTTAHDPAPQPSNGKARTQGAWRGDLHPGMEAARLSGATEQWLDDGTPGRDAGIAGATAGEVGACPPSEQQHNGQPPAESETGYASDPLGSASVSPLPEDDRASLGGYVCPCGGRDIKYVADHWRPGVVLDPFAGSGTVLSVASGHGRDSIGIDLDERNADLARQWVGMFLEVEYPRVVA